MAPIATAFADYNLIDPGTLGAARKSAEPAALREAALSPRSLVASDRPMIVEGLGLKLMPIAKGSVTMGSPSSEADRSGDENQVAVTISRSFWMGQTEVTQAQWQAHMGNNPSKHKGGSFPVEQVSWEDCMSFCQKLTDRERAAGRLPSGYRYTLPTEAQWEFACRAGTTGAYAGSLDTLGWYDKNSGNETHAVGQKQANAWGLYDMHGNVWEWCADWYEGKLAGGADPSGAASGSNRVFRGGGFSYSAAHCRSAYRVGREPGIRSFSLGFRLALSPIP